MSSKPFVILELKTAAERLLRTGVPLKSSCPAVQLIVPSLFHVVPAIVFNPPFRVETAAAAVLKMPALEIVPPLQLNALLTDTFPVRLSAPLDSVSVFADKAPLEVSVPPAIDKVPATDEALVC